MKKCSDCSEWQEAGTESVSGDCLEHDKMTNQSDSCASFSPDPTRYCAICGAKAIEAEHSSMECSKSDSHGASQWDYEWHDFANL